MAQRIGERHATGAPDGGGAPDWHAARPSRVGGRSNALFLLPLPFALQALSGDPATLALKLSAAALLLAAAWLTREGLRADEAWEARPTARRPALPRKALAAAALGLGLGLGGIGAGLAAAVIFAALGAGLHLAAFGFDPMRDRAGAGTAADLEALQADRVARAVEGAERHLREMTAAIAPLGDRALADRVARFQHGVREMARALERDPRGLGSARRYLGVYLLGARDATVRFADLYGRSRAADLRADYEALLDDLEGGYAARTQALGAGDRTALEVEMEVLRDRLSREGLHPEGARTRPAAPPTRPLTARG